MRDKISTSYRLTPAALNLIAQLSEKLGINKADVIELAVRDFGAVHGLYKKAPQPVARGK
jgi:hypothetical protein